MDVMEAIKGRRSVRKYKSDPVSDETLKTVLEAVKWAPSWANTQCWEIIVVKDQKLKEELSTALREGNPATASMTEAPILLVLCGKKGVSGCRGGQPVTGKGDWWMFDIGLAMQNLCLAAYAMGLGTVIIGAFNHKKVEEILGLPQNVEVLAMTPLGYPAGTGAAPKRKEVSEFVFYEKYGVKG